MIKQSFKAETDKTLMIEHTLVAILNENDYYLHL